MTNSEYLESAYKQALAWANTLGFSQFTLSTPTPPSPGMVQVLENVSFLKGPQHHFTALAIYSRENQTWGEQSYGIQVISPLSQPILEVEYMIDSGLAIQWHNFSDQHNRRVITTNLNNDVEQPSRHLSLYNDSEKRAVSILRMDEITRPLVHQVAGIWSPEGLAIQILLGHIDATDFDKMLNNLLGP
jgi:hypothetical protein